MKLMEWCNSKAKQRSANHDMTCQNMPILWLTRCISYMV